MIWILLSHDSFTVHIQIYNNLRSNTMFFSPSHKETHSVVFVEQLFTSRTNLIIVWWRNIIYRNIQFLYLECISLNVIQVHSLYTKTCKKYEFLHMALYFIVSNWWYDGYFHKNGHKASNGTNIHMNFTCRSAVFHINAHGLSINFPKKLDRFRRDIRCLRKKVIRSSYAVHIETKQTSHA